MAMQSRTLPGRTGYVTSGVVWAEWLCNFGRYRGGMVMQPRRLLERKGYTTATVACRGDGWEEFPPIHCWLCSWLSLRWLNARLVPINPLCVPKCIFHTNCITAR